MDLPVDLERRKGERRFVPGWSALFKDMQSAGLSECELDAGP